MARFLMLQIQGVPYAGVAYICGAVRSRGHSFSLFIHNDIKKIIEDIDKEKPDIIGFSCMTCFFQDYSRIAKKIKEKYDIPIIMGGPHPTLCPEETLNDPSIDIICRGEGEFALIELLNSIDRGIINEGILNLWFKNGVTIIPNKLRPLVDPLDEIPLIDWTCYKGTLAQYSNPIAFLIRGCPFSCSYCFNETMRNIYSGLGKYVRHFSIERSLLEIQAAINVFQPGPVLFTSDSFGIDLLWMEELFNRYRTITELSFVLLLRPELATEKCISILAHSHCLSVAIGVESGSERVRKEILNRNYSNSQLLDVAEILHNHNIKFRTYNMIGLPTETEDEIWETIEINCKMKTDYPRAGIFTPMPKTKIMDIVQSHGLISGDFDCTHIPKTILSDTVLKNCNQDRIQATLYFFQSAIIFPKLKKGFRFLMGKKPTAIGRFWFYCIYTYLHMKSEGRKFFPYLLFIYANRHYK
jgi:anaerobic magnesium-protoporphyrin IX monomethyl ester cyclase